MKRVIVLAVVAGAAAMAVACGGGGNSGGGANTPASSATKAPAATSAPTKAATSSSGTSSGKVPGDVCSLVTSDELAQIAAGAGQGEAQTQTTAQVTSTSCYWKFGDGLLSLTVTVTTLPSDTPADVLKTSLQAEAKDAGQNGRELSGIGDFAIYTSTSGIVGDVRVLLKGLLLDLNLNGPGARGLGDKLVPLAKAAAGRI